MGSNKTFIPVEAISRGKVNIKSKLGLDDRDDIIIQMLQKNPQTSQEEIAKILKLSQPSVWARIRNLKEKGVIKHVVGVDFKTVSLPLAKVDVSATDTKGVIETFKDCPYFINAFVTSGKFNVCLFFTGIDLEHIEGIVNHHLRSNANVKEVDLSIVISSSKNFVMPLNLDCTNKKQQDCPQECKKCFN